MAADLSRQVSINARSHSTKKKKMHTEMAIRLVCNCDVESLQLAHHGRLNRYSEGAPVLPVLGLVHCEPAARCPLLLCEPCVVFRKVPTVVTDCQHREETQSQRERERERHLYNLRHTASLVAPCLNVLEMQHTTRNKCFAVKRSFTGSSKSGDKEEGNRALPYQYLDPQI